MRALISTLAVVLFAGTSGITHADVAKKKTVTCADGSKSVSGRGACTKHGGVAKTKTTKTTKTTTARKSGTETVRCADGTTSVAKRGACSGHGGVRAERRVEKEASKTVRCEDGTTSVAGRGACSGHGGIRDSRARVERRADTEPIVKRPPIAPSQATALCKDGTYSYSLHRAGTCSHHGGVDMWFIN